MKMAEFYSTQHRDKRNEYLDYLARLGMLSGLFSDSDDPYLYYRAHENLFCKVFDANNLSRGDISYDAKVMGLGYPGGPVVNRLANEGDPKAFTFSKPHIPGYDYSFSGLKTSFLYTLRDHLQEDPDFVEKHKADLCASLQATVIDILMNKLRKAAKDLGIKEVAVAGGVSANSGLRDAFLDHARRYGWKVHIPKFSFTTDNAAMVAITGYYKYMDKEFCPMEAAPFSRVQL